MPWWLATRDVRSVGSVNVENGLLMILRVWLCDRAYTRTDAGLVEKGEGSPETVNCEP